MKEWVCSSNVIMNKKRYILKRKEINTNKFSKAEIDKLKKLLSSHHVDIIDNSMFPKMILVETNEKLPDVISQDFKKKWSIFPETTYEVHDTRKFIKPKK